MSNKIIRNCDKYNMKRYTDFGIPLTYNKLHHIVNDHTNTHNRNILTDKQLHNHMIRYINCEIDVNELNNTMQHYIGN